MLLHLIALTDVNRNYEKSDVLQVIRILRTHDFIKDSQMDLFGRTRRRTTAVGQKPSAGAAADAGRIISAGPSTPSSA